MKMFKLGLLGLSALALAACQPPADDTNVEELQKTMTAEMAEFKEATQLEITKMRDDVESLKTIVYANPPYGCKADMVLPSPDSFMTSLDGLPSADLEPDAWHAANGERPDVVTTESGLQYSVIKTGYEGGLKPVGGQMIRVNYHGFFPNGEKFDSAFDRGEPSEFPANRVIKGWVEALADMEVCEARTLYIPGDLAYGKQGRASIPPNATLIFYVQLLGIKP